jgi:chemotaxis protein MotB
LFVILYLFRKTNSFAWSKTMTRMSTLALLLAGLMMTATGCVSQRNQDDLITSNRRLQEQLVDLQSQIESKNEEIRILQTATRPADPATLALIEKLRTDRDRLDAALAAATKQIRDAGNITIESALPEQLNNALANLAKQNPGIMTYDAKRGMVQLRSDLTFALGSIEIKPAGKTALQQLANVINSEAASKYGVRVVGHTDNVPVTNARNKARFGDNWGLSAFRAISVKNVFGSAAISPTRVEIAGRGEFQPIVPNGPQGAEGNRRVEIFLVRMDGAGLANAPVAPAIVEEAPKAAIVVEDEGPEAFK